MNVRDYEQLRKCYPDTLSFLREILSLERSRDKEVVWLRTGFCGDLPLSLDRIAREFKVTRERVRQIENKAIGILYGRSLQYRKEET